jgi:peroxiredoxin Q/BCP
MNYPLKNGDPAPEFTLQNVHGTDWTLSSHLGKMVILLFNRGEYCPTGRGEFARWSSYARLFPKLNGEMVFIVNGGREQHAHYAEQARIGRPILVDEGGQIGEAYGVYGVNTNEAAYPGFLAPTLHLIDAEGKISSSWYLTGPRGLPTPECLLGILGYAEHNDWKY